MRVETTQVFIAEDGKQFLTEQECKDYEKVLKTHSYWSFVYGADLTEGRGYSQELLVKLVNIQYDREAWLDDYAFRLMGRKLSFIQGVQATPSWKLQASTLERFQGDPLPGYGECGGRRVKRITLTPGSGEQGLIEMESHL